MGKERNKEWLKKNNKERIKDMNYQDDPKVLNQRTGM